MTDYPQTGSILPTVSLRGDFYSKAIQSVATLTGSMLVVIHLSGPILPSTTLSAVGGGGSAGFRQSGSILPSTTLEWSDYFGGIIPRIFPSVTLTGEQEVAYHQSGSILPTTDLLGSLILDAVLTGSIPVTATLDGSQTRNFILRGSITPATTLSWAVRLDLVSTGPLFVQVTMRGTQIGSTAAQINADAAYREAGHLPYFPDTIYALNVDSADDVADIDFGLAFLMSGSFVGVSGNLFYESGANANFIGFKLGSAAVPRYVFRAPRQWEVIWSIPDSNVYRYELNRDTGMWSWSVYRTLPQRYLDSVQAFNLFDPDKIYDYYAKIVGAVQGQLSMDNASFARLRNPNFVPAALIPVAARAVGARFDASLDVAKQRAALGLAIPTARERGLSEAVTSYLRQFGYTGWAAEVWTRIAWASVVLTGYDSVVSSDINNLIVIGSPDGKKVIYCRQNIKPGVDVPGSATLQTSYAADTASLAADLVAYPAIQAAVSGAAADLTSAAAAFTGADLVAGISAATSARDALVIAAADIAALALPSDPLELQTRSAYLASLQSHFVDGILSKANIDVTTVKNGVTSIYRFSATVTSGVNPIDDGADATEVMTHLATEMNVVDGGGSAVLVDDTFPIAIDVPHNYSVSEPGVYWASPFVTIHMNNADGTRLNITNDIIQIVSPEMLFSVLPVACRIHAFATDIEVDTEVIGYFEGAVPGPFSGLALTEDFAITQV